MSRLDAELYARSLTKSRTLARNIIKDGIVFVNGALITKPSFEVSREDIIEIKGEMPKYVSRGGVKLEKAIEVFGIDLNGRVCLDVGASTGGFTDCMLKHGAKLVYAVDVGTAQLDESLKNDERVISLENTDIRSAALPQKADFASIDVSFVSLKLILPSVKPLINVGGEAVALIKPQFEVGKSGIGKRGIVKNAALREKAAEEIKDFAVSVGFSFRGLILSPITGGDGNAEYLIHLSL